MACTEAPAAANEHSTGQDERAGHPQSVSGISRQRHGTPEPLSSPGPSAVASLEKLRAEVGSKAMGETLKLSRVEQSKHVRTSPLQVFGYAPLTLKLCNCEKPTPEECRTWCAEQ